MSIHTHNCPACFTPQSTPDTCEECRTKPIYMGFTLAELHAAFELVKPADNWKNPIAARVPKSADLRAIDAAICFYCGGDATFRELSQSVLVTAPGYYVLIGA